jgi:hypothetical protein
MLERLKRHPFAVETFFRRSLVLTYALPAEVLQPMIGPGLELDTLDTAGARLGFLAIALVQTEKLRPRGLPAFLGRDFFLSGYRIFTRLVRPGRPTLRGLRILRSDTDRAGMVRMGNLFTHYGYRHAQVSLEADEHHLAVRIQTPGREADLSVDARLQPRPAPLPEGSPFRSLDEARHFAGPLPFTFSHSAELGGMVVVKGVRSEWDPQPVAVTVHHATYLEQPALAAAGPRLANAFYLENVPYWWQAGTVEPLS